MPYDILEARYLHDYVVWVRFRDGTAGEVDLAAVVGTGVFAALTDPAEFRSFRLHPEFHTIVWPNGADLAPKFLYQQVMPESLPPSLSRDVSVQAICRCFGRARSSIATSLSKA